MSSCLPACEWMCLFLPPSQPAPFVHCICNDWCPNGNISFLSVINPFSLFSGVCYCFTNQTGVDCSLSSVDPPTLTSLKGGEICDTYVSNCLPLVIYGNNFVNSYNLTCHFTQIRVRATCVCLGGGKLFGCVLRNIVTPTLTFKVEGQVLLSFKMLLIVWPRSSLLLLLQFTLIVSCGIIRCTY